MSHQEIMQRMIGGSGLSWDTVVEPDASWNDLDLDKIRRFMDAVRRAGRRPIPEGTNEHEFLEKLELLKDGQPTRAALLLFVTQPTRRFSFAHLKLGRFRSPTLIVGDREKVAEAFFYVKLIEQWGSGTTRMADALQEAGLPEPEFDVDTPSLFRLTLRQDPFTEERLQELGLNERQRQAVAYVREKGRITNQEYRQLTGVSNKTAYLDLNGLVDKQVLAVRGTGKTLGYVLSRGMSNEKVTER
jgi:predicted HTH transcriptional regulator